MNLREIANVDVPEIGLGCMNVSHAYGTPPTEKDAIHLLQQAFDRGVRHFDTAALYGFGANETLVGKALKGRRKEIFLASKCGMTGVDGKRVIDGRPETLMATIDESLQRLQTDHIDLYYLHRWDKAVPIEESVGALSRMVEQGKIGAIGLSEVSTRTLIKADAVHRIAAVQTEYSLWSRNAEIGILTTCLNLGVTFVAFSPLGRGFLGGAITQLEQLSEKDIRKNMPRFQGGAFESNLRILEAFKQLAADNNCSMAQLALSWVLAQGEHIIPIPGTTSLPHLGENLATSQLRLEPSVLLKAGYLINQATVQGNRYADVGLGEVDTETFK